MNLALQIVERRKRLRRVKRLRMKKNKKKRNGERDSTWYMHASVLDGDGVYSLLLRRKVHGVEPVVDLVDLRVFCHSARRGDHRPELERRNPCFEKKQTSPVAAWSDVYIFTGPSAITV